MVIISTAIISMVVATTLNVAVSLTVSAEHELTDQIGTTAQCCINNPSTDQINKLQSLSEIGSVGYEINAGEAYYGSYKIKLVYVQLRRMVRKSEASDHRLSREDAGRVI